MMRSLISPRSKNAESVRLGTRSRRTSARRRSSTRRSISAAATSPRRPQRLFFERARSGACAAARAGSASGSAQARADPRPAAPRARARASTAAARPRSGPARCVPPLRARRPPRRRRPAPPWRARRRSVASDCAVRRQLGREAQRLLRRERLVVGGQGRRRDLLLGDLHSGGPGRLPQRPPRRCARPRWPAISSSCESITLQFRTDAWSGGGRRRFEACVSSVGLLGSTDAGGRLAGRPPRRAAPALREPRGWPRARSARPRRRPTDARTPRAARVPPRPNRVSSPAASVTRAQAPATTSVAATIVRFMVPSRDRSRMGRSAHHAPAATRPLVSVRYARRSFGTCRMSAGSGDGRRLNRSDPRRHVRRWRNEDDGRVELCDLGERTTAAEVAVGRALRRPKIARAALVAARSVATHRRQPAHVEREQRQEDDEERAPHGASIAQDPSRAPPRRNETRCPRWQRPPNLARRRCSARSRGPPVRVGL